MRTALTTIVSLSVIVASLASQSGHTISPAGHHLAYAATSTGYPWGYPTASFPQFRYQQIHDDLAGPLRVLVGLAIRRKEGGAAYAAFTSTLQLDLSTAAVNSQLATSTYATNHGANKATVMLSRGVSFPAVSAPTGNLPAPYSYTLVFDQPYIHNGAGGICWEVVMTSNTNTASLSFDLAYNGVARNQTYGTGCAGAALSGSYTAPNLVLTASGLTPNAAAAFLIGADNVRFAGLPLPVDLSIINASGCWLYVEPLVTVSLPTDATGTAVLPTNVSALPSFSVCVQVAAPSAAIPFGVAFSNGLSSSPAVPKAFMRNWGSAITAATGSYQSTYAVVTDFIQP